MSHATHANAALTPRARLRLAGLIVDHEWSPARAAERYDVSWRTAAKWAERYRAEGPDGMNDRSSRPHHQPHPGAGGPQDRAPALEAAPGAGRDRRPAGDGVLDRARGPGPVPAQPAHHIDRATGEPIRRYEHHHPGDMLHVDVKKLGRVPDGGGWRYVGKQQLYTNRSATVRRTGKPRSKWRNPVMGTCFLHTVIDDHSRVVFVEAHDDEPKETAAAVLRHAVAWFAERGVTVQRVLSDNGSCYKSHLWRDTCTELGITAKETRPDRPQTNGKIERFHRTLAEGWAFKKFYN